MKKSAFMTGEKWKGRRGKEFQPFVTAHTQTPRPARRKQMDEAADMGVMMYFSFLLVEKKFITVFPRKKTVKTKHMILVTFLLIK